LIVSTEEWHHTSAHSPFIEQRSEVVPTVVDTAATPNGADGVLRNAHARRSLPAPPGTMAGMPLPTPTLHTARLRLRPFAGADADALFALHSSAYVLRYWDAPPWTQRERAERFIAACREMAEDGSGARLAIERVPDGAFIGWCGLTRWNPDYRSASLGYCLGDLAWGHGYATEAARAVLQWAFDTLDLNRVQAETDTRNVASARVLEKLDFMREGTLREDCIVNGEVSDSWVYGLLRRRWRPSSLPE
jgi:ribosomal-protein-alanine N-acetyltransferase